MLTSFDLAGPDPSPMSRAEVAVLKTIVRGLPNNCTVVQIGAERGCSTLAIVEERPDVFVLSIDIGPRPEEFENLKKADHNVTNVVRALGRSQEIGCRWPLRWTADLVYVDGDHRFQGVSGDIASWLPIVSEGGVLAFHDYIHPDIRAPQIVGRVFEAVNHWHLSDHYETIAYVERLIAFRIHHPNASEGQR